MNDELNIERIARLDLLAYATVGDLRRKLEEASVRGMPDGANIIFVEMDCINVPASDDYGVEQLESGQPPFEHLQTVNLVLEWDL